MLKGLIILCWVKNICGIIIKAAKGKTKFKEGHSHSSRPFRQLCDNGIKFFPGRFYQMGL